MAHQLDIYLLILLLSMITHLCWCARYNNYIEYGLENYNICNPLNKVYTYDIRNASAVIVREKHFFDRWNVNYDRRCRFIFKTTKGEGLFAVIQKMFFRLNGSSCLDYVQFKRSDGYQTSKFCGVVDRSSPNYFGSYSTRDYSHSEFDPIHDSSKIGKLETEIFISKQSVPDGQSLDLKITYTPYRTKKEAYSVYFRECSDIIQSEIYQYQELGYNSCIRKEYICDGIKNCVAMCDDEYNCSNADVVSREDTTTEVTVGAVTTVILCFIIFVMCLWICKRSQKLCWSSDCAGPNVCSRSGSLPPDADGPASRAVPTAPMLEVAVSSPVADKDLPPSYDSLFPEQSNPARS